MPTKTIVQVNTEPRTFDSRFGEMAAVRVTFDDGTEGEVVCKPDNAPKVIGTLTGLKGQPHEYGLEDKGAFPDGSPKPQKITAYPGKPGVDTGGGGGGGRRGTTPEEQVSIHASVALEHAVSLHQREGTSPEGVLSTAQLFFDWLREVVGSPQSPQVSPPGKSSPARTGSSEEGPDAGTAPPPPRPEPAAAEGTGEPATDIQWQRAAKILGTKGKVMRRLNTRFGVAKPEDATKAQLATIIEGALA